MFSEMEFDVIYKALKRCAIEDAFPSKIPKAIILGGQPGAGKSSLITRLKMEKDNNIIVISGDDFRKEHPHFASFMSNMEMPMLITLRSFHHR